MATWTEAQLAEKVLSRLGVKAQGQNPSAEDLDLVTAIIDSVVDGLRPTGAIIFGIDAIPEWAQVPLRDMVAYEVAPDFGRALPEAVYNRAKSAIVANANVAPALSPAKVRYF